MANSFIYSTGGSFDSAPVANVYIPVNSANNSFIYSIPGDTINSAPVANTYTPTNNVTNPVNSLPDNILGIHIKTKAERDADKAVKDAEDSRIAEEASVARNPDGSFAYGYTNGTGAQYISGAQYTDARYVTNTRGNNLTASAGSILLGGFLPTTFWGWVLVILLIGILFAVIRALIDKMNVRKPHVHPAH